MPDKDPGHIHVQPNNMDIVWYYIVLYSDNLENDFGNRYCNYRIFRKSFESVCMNNSCHKDRDGHKVYNYRHDLKRNPFSVVFYDSAMTTTFASSSSYEVEYNLVEVLRC